MLNIQEVYEQYFTVVYRYLLWNYENEPEKAQQKAEELAVKSHLI